MILELTIVGVNLKNQSIDDTDFLAKSCAENCFKFDENSPDHFSHSEAEDLLKSISKNPVVASAMKVLLSKYLWYCHYTEMLPKCEITKRRDDKCCYRRGMQSYEHYIGNQKINLRPDWKNETEKPFAFFNIGNKQSTDFNQVSIKRQLTHEIMHFMDAVLMEDGIRNKRLIPITQKMDLNFLTSDTLKQNLRQNFASIEEANKSIECLGWALHQSLHGVYDNTTEMWGMYGFPCLSFSIKSEPIDINFDDEDIVQPKDAVNYEFAYEPINDAMSHLYGFESNDEFVGKIRLNHKREAQLLPVAPILEKHFHIYSFYKQDDVKQAFEFSTKV